MAYDNKVPAVSLGRGQIAYSFGASASATISASGVPGVSRVSGIVTVTTSAAHNFLPGQQVAIDGVTAVGTTFFGGKYRILTVPSTTTFTYHDPQKPDDTGGGGTATSIAGETTSDSLSGQRVSLASLDAAEQSFSVVFQFTAAPSASSYVLQGADVDVEGAYITVQTYSLTADYRESRTGDKFKFMRIQRVSQTGAGKTLAYFAR